MSAWYVLPFGIMFSAVAIRLVGKLALKNRRNRPRAFA
jgi:sulfoxide reductase heme-binding subunit YedZ